ncbi:MAG: hypothetical protein RL754_673 [Bacteroidota bacterium]|jgi:hypothetical protein
MQELDDKFKRALEGYTELPNPAVWDKIGAALDAAEAEKTAPTAAAEAGQRSQARMTVVYRRAMVAAISVAAVFALVFTVLWPTVVTTVDPVGSEVAGPDADAGLPLMIAPVIEEGVDVVENDLIEENTELLAAQTPVKRSATPAENTTREAATPLHGLRLKSAAIETPEALAWNALPAFEGYEAQAGAARKNDSQRKWTESALNVSDLAAVGTEKIGHWMGKSARQVTETTAKTVSVGVYNWELAKINLNQTLATINKKP